MRFWQLIRQSLEAITRARLRSLLTMFGIAIASGALVCMVAFALGLQAQVEAPFKLLGLLNNIQVFPRPASADDAADGEDEDPPLLDDAAIERIESLPGVDYAFPDLRISRLRVTCGDHTEEATYTFGLPREVALLNYLRDFLLAGDFFSSGDQPEAIIGEQLAKRLGFDDAEQAVGQMAQVTASGLEATSAQQYRMQNKTMEVRIVGVYRPPSFASQIRADAMLLPVDLMHDMPGASLESMLHRMRARSGDRPSPYAQVIVHVEQISDVSRVERQIQEMGFEARTFIRELQDIRRSFLFMEVLLASVGTVALVVAGLGIANTLLMTVMERSQEIGLYKAVGASDGDIRVLFLTEAGVLGFFGALGGLLLAWIVAMILQRGINLYASYEDVPEPGSVFRFPLWLLASAVLFSVAISVMSGWFPSSRAARLDPIRALRRE